MKKDKDSAHSLSSHKDNDLNEKYYNDEEKERPEEIFNNKALEVMDRIKKKLNGKDFEENE